MAGESLIPATERNRTGMTTLTLEQETNPWEAQAARFDDAAQRLNLDAGIWKVLRYPTREIIVHDREDRPTRGQFGGHFGRARCLHV